MTRVATPRNEEYLLGIARHGTAAHVEKVVSNYRWCKRLEALEDAMNEMFEEQRNEPVDVSAETLNQSKSQIKETAWKSPPQPCPRCGAANGWIRTLRNW